LAWSESSTPDETCAAHLISHAFVHFACGLKADPHFARALGTLAHELCDLRQSRRLIKVAYRIEIVHRVEGRCFLVQPGGTTLLHTHVGKCHIETCPGRARRHHVVRESLNHRPALGPLRFVFGGATLLQAAASRGNMQLVQHLCQQGAHPNAAKKDGITALYLASGRGHLEVVKYLCQLGADKNMATRSGSTAVDSAAYQGHAEILEYLKGQTPKGSPKRSQDSPKRVR